MASDPPSMMTSGGTPSVPGRSEGAGPASVAAVSPSSTRSSIELQAFQILRQASRRRAALEAARALDRSFDRQYAEFNRSFAALDALLDRLESVSDADLSQSILALSPHVTSPVGPPATSGDGRPTPRDLSDSFGDRDPASVQFDTEAALADEGLVLQDRSLVADDDDDVDVSFEDRPAGGGNPTLNVFPEDPVTPE
ncbi:hypothetical protein THAOC_12383, partial [Thalassiosira oceanica]